MLCNANPLLAWTPSGFGDAAQAPVDFTTAPAKAVPRALAAAGVEASDCEYHEINEAFAAVVLANQRVRHPVLTPLGVKLSFDTLA